MLPTSLNLLISSILSPGGHLWTAENGLRMGRNQENFCSIGAHRPSTGARLAKTIHPRALNLGVFCDKLVSMTSSNDSFPSQEPKSPRRPRGPRQPGHWLLQDAKARFSELVRQVRSEGPQHVTVHGRDEVVVISAEEFRRLNGDLTGAALIAAMQASPARDIDIEPTRAPLPVRDVTL